MGRLLIVLSVAALAACAPPGASSAGGTAGPTDAPATQSPGGSSVAGMCAPDTPDCVDTVVEPAPDETLTDREYRQGARSLLGVAEADLPPGVRIGRRGDEQMALTEDYRVGRMTVELDQDVDSIYRVTTVIAELADGPETFTADR